MISGTPPPHPHPHGGPRPFHEKSTGLHTIKFRALCGASVVTSCHDVLGNDTLVVNRQGAPSELQDGYALQRRVVLISCEPSLHLACQKEKERGRPGGRDRGREIESETVIDTLDDLQATVDACQADNCAEHPGLRD